MHENTGVNATIWEELEKLNDKEVKMWLYK
jgi:hypothetical protein